MRLQDMKFKRMDGFFCAFWVQQRAKELLYFAEYMKHSSSGKILSKNQVHLLQQRFFPRMFLCFIIYVFFNNIITTSNYM